MPRCLITKIVIKHRGPKPTSCQSRRLAGRSSVKQERRTVPPAFYLFNFSKYMPEWYHIVYTQESFQSVTFFPFRAVLLGYF